MTGGGQGARRLPGPQGARPPATASPSPVSLGRVRRLPGPQGTRRLLFFVLLWTLALLLLGSVVHATESSLACPDWPTCFGSMMPEMTGGVFWEHLHRLWAGALVLLFAATAVVARRAHPGRRDVFWLGVGGLAQLVVQSLLGGATVIYKLPDALSTAHLAMAFVFLLVVVAMLERTGPGWTGAESDRRATRRMGVAGTCAVFLQSVGGAVVRHTDAGVACPDVPLCLGWLAPPLDHPLVAIHFQHRALGVLVVGLVLWHAWRVLTRVREPVARRLAAGMAVVVVSQMLLGFVSVAQRLGAPWVSAHTLLAAVLLTLAATAAGRARAGGTGERPEPSPGGDGSP